MPTVGPVLRNFLMEGQDMPTVGPVLRNFGGQVGIGLHKVTENNIPN